ncbi:MAG: arginase family protein [Gemmatimonadota bacterium]|nr:arginase family protein [Gemmatimonadota bacterium]
MLRRPRTLVLAAALLAACAPGDVEERPDGDEADDLAEEGPPVPALTEPDGTPRVALVKMPYHGGRNVPELSGGPDYLEAGGISETLAERAVLRPVRTVELTEEEERQYGEWNRMGLANAHLADFVEANLADSALTVGLLANCTSVIGVLAGLQGDGPGERRIGLVFIDAHGDFNTPETTLSGMLGGMPVAVSAGLALHNLRNTSGLEDPIPTEHIVMGALRDLDPLEAELIEEHALARVSTDDFRARSEKLHAEMRRLSEETDVIYVHIDMDVLDPAEVPGHPLTVPDGPTSEELAAALTEMFRYPKVAALGIASTPWGDRDPDGVSRRAAYNLIEGALAGVRGRDGA